MTEDEARTKWCPFAKSRILHLPLDDTESWALANDEGNRVKGSDLCCIASDCMAWRTDWRGLGGEETTDGYCGLAGKA